VSILAAAVRLRAELEELAAVLASADGDTLVAMEERLSAALNALSNPEPARIDYADRIAVAGALLGARTALNRCRILGGGIGSVTHATLAARGHHGTYDHAGVEAAPDDVRGVSVDARL
jgi:hypothetical protein